MEAVTVAEVVITLKPLWPLTQGPTLHVCFIVLHQGLLKQSYGSFVVAFIVQLHCCCEGALWWRRERGSWQRGMMGRVRPSVFSKALYVSQVSSHIYLWHFLYKQMVVVHFLQFYSWYEWQIKELDLYWVSSFSQRELVGVQLENKERMDGQRGWTLVNKSAHKGFKTQWHSGFHSNQH